MVMTGDANIISSWIEENEGKVVEVDESTANIIGQSIVPEGTTNTYDEHIDGKIFRNTYIAGLFTISGGQIWTLQSSEDITPE